MSALHTENRMAGMLSRALVDFSPCTNVGSILFASVILGMLIAGTSEVFV